MTYTLKGMRDLWMPITGVKMNFLQAVARMEGFYAEGSRPHRNHNPGDIEYGRFAIAHGACGSDGRFALFPNPDVGFAAMQALFASLTYQGLTVAEALNKWAPPIENQTNHYIANVCQWVGCQPTDSLAATLVTTSGTAHP